jgi:uncharacterized Zn finger protein (UPF0148 family)
MRALTCPKCGGPLAPGVGEVRVRCEHCGATVDVTSDGVARLAETLQRAGVHVSPSPMSTDDVRAEIAEREAAEAETRRMALVVIGVLAALGLVVAVAVFAFG